VRSKTVKISTFLRLGGRLVGYGLLLISATACDPTTMFRAEASTDKEESMSNSVDVDAVSVVTAFFASGPALKGTTGDQDHARRMVETPPLRPSVVTTTRHEVLEGIVKVHGAGVDDAFLYGDVESVQGEGACEVVSYQGLLSGGVLACVDPTSNAVIAVWLSPEG